MKAEDVRLGGYVWYLGGSTAEPVYRGIARRVLGKICEIQILFKRHTTRRLLVEVFATKAEALAARERLRNLTRKP